jgi:hypothetical protein
MPLQMEAAPLLRPLLEGGLVLGVGLLILGWAATSRYFELLFLGAVFALLVYASR